MPKKINKNKSTISPVKKNSKNYKRKNKINIIYIPFFVLIVILSFIFIYIIFIYPKILSKDILNEIIDQYSPLFIEDINSIKVLKLKESPEVEKNIDIYNKIYNKYEIETIFEKITNNDNKGINKISFLKNGKPYNNIPPVYIYWDENIDTTPTIVVNNEKKVPIIKKEKEIPVQKNEKIKEENEIKNLKINSTKKEDSINNYSHNIKIAKKEKPSKKYKIAIIIDDVGYDYKTTYDFLELGVPITFAIIPDMAKSQKFYSLINQYKYESILHIPMEPQKGKNFVEKNAILTEMDDVTIKRRIKEFIDRYPAIIGANNHMGSKACTDPRVMKNILEELKNNNKIWVDSMTTINTISKNIAEIYNLPYYERDIFLDNNKDIESIRESFELLIKEAKKKGYAIGIGHVQTSNLPFVIKEYYNKKDQLDIDFVFLSEIQK